MALRIFDKRFVAVSIDGTFKREYLFRTAEARLMIIPI